MVKNANIHTQRCIFVSLSKREAVFYKADNYMMKRILLATAIFFIVNSVTKADVPITIENFSFELPGTTRQLNWENVPGWSSDSSAIESGVETGWGATDGIWSDFLTGTDTCGWLVPNATI